jgi:hypothetical protein
MGSVLVRRSVRVDSALRKPVLKQPGHNGTALHQLALMRSAIAHRPPKSFAKPNPMAGDSAPEALGLARRESGETLHLLLNEQRGRRPTADARSLEHVAQVQGVFEGEASRIAK